MVNTAVENKMSTELKLITITLMCILSALVVYGITYGGLEAIVSPYLETCLELLDYSDLTMKQCVTYLDENPGSTGQQIIDHYEIANISLPEKVKLEKILTEPIYP